LADAVDVAIGGRLELVVEFEPHPATASSATSMMLSSDNRERFMRHSP
jgi:hypothetical protein